MIDLMHSQKYAIVQFLIPIEDGYVFSMDDWPPHVTLADVFAVNLDEQVIVSLFKFSASHKLFSSTAGNETNLGSVESPTKVTLIQNSIELQALHNNLIDVLSAHGAVFNVPQFTREGFLPHSTVQESARLKAGDNITFDKISLVDMFVNGDWRQRKVLQGFSLQAG